MSEKKFKKVVNMSNSEVVFVDGGDDGSKRLKSKKSKCTCGGGLTPEYGFCNHGLGSFMRCMECSSVFDFSEDAD